MYYAFHKEHSSLPIYFPDNSSTNDESDSSEVGVDNECDTMHLQCGYKASPPVESNVDTNNDRAGSEADGFILNVLHDYDDYGNNEKCISEYDLFSNMSNNDSGKNDDNAAEYDIFSDMIVNHSMKKDNNDAIENYDLFSDMSE
jgi:hypothetical protein